MQYLSCEREIDSKPQSADAANISNASATTADAAATNVSAEEKSSTPVDVNPHEAFGFTKELLVCSASDITSCNYKSEEPP